MKTNARKKCSRIFLLLVSILLVFTLSSCSEAGSETILDKETLQETVDSASSSGASYVWTYLDDWDFPRFNYTRIREVENNFSRYYYKNIINTIDSAKATANTFLEYYYSEINLNDVTDVTDALICSYVYSVGDKYCDFRNPVQHADYVSDMRGNYVGIGITVTQEENGEMTVTDVSDGSSAKDAGVLAGDTVKSVDGKSVSDVGYAAAVDMIRGEENTDVTLEIMREGKSLTFKLKRKSIVESSVTYSIKDGIGYIKISSFKGNTDEQFKAAIDYMEQNGAVGIVYDLRSNGGGYLSSVENMLSYIAPEGMTLVSFSNDYDSDFKSNDPHVLKLPSVVVCNGRTASAAELFTAGIRDIGASEGFDVSIVGTTTYGKGIMQSTYNLKDDYTLTLTVAYYSPPSGVNYHGVGIKPDIEVENNGNEDTQLAMALAEIRLLTGKN